MLTANSVDSRSNEENLQLRIQMKSFEKPKRFCESFIAFLESTLNLQHFAKTNQPDS